MLSLKRFTKLLSSFRGSILKLDFSIHVLYRTSHETRHDLGSALEGRIASRKEGRVGMLLQDQKDCQISVLEESALPLRHQEDWRRGDLCTDWECEMMPKLRIPPPGPNGGFKRSNCFREGSHDSRKSI